MNEKEWKRFAFASMTGIGRKTKRKLLEHFTEEEMIAFSSEDWKKLLNGRDWKHYQRYKEHINIEEIEKEWARLKEKGVNFVYFKDEAYPKRLKAIEDFPIGLYYKGRLPDDRKSIAIVGSRIPTPYGREMAEYFARELGAAGISIISGLACGIDAAAHRGALEGKGDTYGILGCGPDIVYPKENFGLYEQMKRRGGILSEYKPGVLPEHFRFPERNRIISGLADGVLVVEAKERSGSLITTDQALEQGKDVFAIPGRAGDVLSEGCNWLIREGARLVTKPSHILEELFDLCENKEKNLTVIDNLLDKKEKIVYDCLSLTPKSIEDIINETNFTVSEVISILFRMELNGHIRQTVRNHYIRRMI